MEFRDRWHIEKARKRKARERKYMRYNTPMVPYRAKIPVVSFPPPTTPVSLPPSFEVSMYLILAAVVAGLFR